MGPGGLAGLPAAVLGQEALTGEVMGRVLPGSLHIRWEDKPSLDARGPHPERLEAGEAGRRRLWF